MRRLFENRFAAAVFAIGLLATAAAPLVPRSTAADLRIVEEPTWPARIDGRAVRELPLSATEERFAANFPGRIKRFTDGRRILILRWVTRATRKLHPASDCFRGLGYDVKPHGVIPGEDGREWGCFSATRGDVVLRVTERIRDPAGNSWTDAQAWFWSAALGRTTGPWWAMTEIR